MSKKPIAQYTDDELLEAYKIGSKWVIDRQQVIGTNTNNLGEPYNHQDFMKGLNRLEQLEKEMQKRGLAY